MKNKKIKTDNAVFSISNHTLTKYSLKYNLHLPNRFFNQQVHPPTLSIFHSHLDALLFSYTQNQTFLTKSVYFSSFFSVDIYIISLQSTPQISLSLSLSLSLSSYIKVITAMYKNNIASVKVGNEVSSWFRTESKLSRVAFYSH